MEIKEMLIEDFYIIKDHLDEYDNFWNENILKSELESENKKYIVVKQNEEILGFAGMLILPDNTEITNIVVKKTERKRGIGNLLLDKLICISKELKKKNISLEVNENNSIAINLYKKHGFEKVGIRKNYYNGINNAIIMTKYF